MTQRTPETALKQYRLICDKLAELESEHRAKTAQLEATRAKIESWLKESVQDFETPEWLFEVNPSLNWTIGVKSDGLATKTHMTIDDQIIPELERKTAEVVKPLKQTLEDIEAWALAELLKRGAKNFSTDLGMASLREDKKYNIPDKKLFIGWCVQNNAESEVTVTLRPNSKFMKSVLEANSELPPGVEQHRVNRVVFTKRQT